MPRDLLEFKESLRYQRRTVGIQRRYLSQQGGVEIVELLRCPLRESISPQDVAIVGGEQYKVEQVQYPEGVVPPVMDLSLSRLEHDYEI